MVLVGVLVEVVVIVTWAIVEDIEFDIVVGSSYSCSSIVVVTISVVVVVAYWSCINVIGIVIIEVSNTYI